MSTGPKVTNIKKHAGVAGQYSYTASVQYEGESAERIEFVGSVYGPPIIMVTPDGTQIPVSDRVVNRLGGQLSPQWVEGFFGCGHDDGSVMIAYALLLVMPVVFLATLAASALSVVTP